MTTRTTLRRDLADLKQKVYELGEKCLEVSELYNMLLENYSNSTEEKLKSISEEVTNESKNLHDQCFLVLTLQQPLIKDLRFVIGSLQIVLNLEKVCEQYRLALSVISEINTVGANFNKNFSEMAAKVQELLRTSIMLYLSSSTDSNEKIKAASAEINLLHDVMYKNILNEVANASGEKAQVEAQLLSVIRSLEKISDLTISMTEQVSYINAGNKSD